MAARGNRERGFPLGAAITLAELSGADPHPALARLRADEPVSWVPTLEGWLVTRHDLAVAVMSDARGFTVDDPRFSTAQVIGPSMLSLDGEEHTRHRAPFVGPFRAGAVAQVFADTVSGHVDRLIDAVAPDGRMELRRQFAGPLSASLMAYALGLRDDEVDGLLRQYDAIVASVTSITAGEGPTAAGAEAFSALRRRLESAITAKAPSLLAAAAADTTSGHPLDHDQIASNGAVMLFGGIETTEGMITNAALELLRRPEQLGLVGSEHAALDGLLDESLRLEPAAAVIDRYATAAAALDGVQIEPCAQGPHVCVGVHLARLEARTAIKRLVTRLPGLRLDPDRAAEARGLVFRKPQRLDVLWG
jgi:cytochrome P450